MILKKHIKLGKNQCLEEKLNCFFNSLTWIFRSAPVSNNVCRGTSWYHFDRRKFRSQTSDNMDRLKSKGGKSQRREEKKKEDQRRERVRRKKMQVREKVGKP